MKRITLLLCLAFLLKLPALAQSAPDKVFTKVDTEASFPGGDEAWKEYLQKNLRGNVPVKKKAPPGVYKVVVKFIVDTEGNLTDIEAETDHGYGMEEEVIRIIKKGPRWSPAIINGKPVNAYRRQPVTFEITIR